MYYYTYKLKEGQTRRNKICSISEILQQSGGTKLKKRLRMVSGRDRVIDW